MNQSDIDKLITIFLKKAGGVIQGNLTPDADKTRNLGAASKRFKTLYVDEVIAGSISSSSGGAAADTVDGFHANSNPMPGTILALNVNAEFPSSVYSEALLYTGERALEGNLVVGDGYTIDEIDLSIHNHDGQFGHGTRINHLDLLNNDADVHPQYPQNGDDELITGNWIFTDLLDRSAGWEFSPTEKLFRAIGSRTVGGVKTTYHNMTLEAIPTTASLKIGQNAEILAKVETDGSDVSLKVGLGDDTVKLSATDPTYRLWVGADTPALAPFSVNKDGEFTATKGLLAGWTIQDDALIGANLTMLAGGELVLGDGTLSDGRADYTKVSAIDPDWRFWAGSLNPAFAPFRVSRFGQVYMEDALVSGVLRSTNFSPGVAGFSLDSNGHAEFNDASFRGRVNAAVFSEDRVSAISGVVVISEAATLVTGLAADVTEAVFDSPVFSINDVILAKGVATVEDNGTFITQAFDEYMRVLTTAEKIADGQYRYLVGRDLAGTGKHAYSAGDTMVRLGTSSQDNPPHGLASGEEGAEFGSYQPGGSVATSAGGWLVLDGSRNFGPFFGVVRREGPVYNQFDTVVRIGNLNGALSKYTDDTYGAFIGDASRYLTYDVDAGLEIKTRSGATSIDDNGIATDEFSLTQVVDKPAFVEGNASLFFRRLIGEDPYVGIRMQADGVQYELEQLGDMLRSTYDTDNDGAVDLANAVKGITAASNDTFYGKNAAGSAGFHAVPRLAVTPYGGSAFTNTTAIEIVGADVTQPEAGKVLVTIQETDLAQQITNKSGGSVGSGTVVIFDSDNNTAFTTSSTPRDLRVCGVVLETIAANAAGRVATLAGHIVDVSCTSAEVKRGQYLCTSSTQGLAQASGYFRGPGDFAIALTSKAAGSTGTVQAMLGIGYAFAMKGTSGYTVGGNVSTTNWSDTQRFTMAATAWSVVSSAALSTAKGQMWGGANTTIKGLYTAGYNGTSTYAIGHTLPFATEVIANTSSLDFGSARRQFKYGFNTNQGKSYAVGGYTTAALNNAAKVTYDTDTLTNLTATLSSARGIVMGLSDGTYIYATGSGNSVNTDLITVATDTVARVSTADLPSAVYVTGFSIPATAGYLINSISAGYKILYATGVRTTHTSNPANSHSYYTNCLTDGNSFAWAFGDSSSPYTGVDKFSASTEQYAADSAAEMVVPKVFSGVSNNGAF